MESTHELVIPNSNLPFKMFEFEGKDGNYHRSNHWHRSIEIFAVFHGHIVFCINGKNYPLSAGEFIIVNSNELHSIYAPVKNNTLVLQIPPSLFGNYLIDNNISFTTYSQKQDHEFMWHLERIQNTYLAKTTGYEFKVQSIFFSVLYDLITKYRNNDTSDESGSKNRGQRQLSMITDYMKENWNTELSLKDTASRFGYTATHLSKMFRKYANTTYHIYLEEIRVSRALNELEHSDRSIGDIASRNGFPNSNAFSKAFKARYGILPSEYRKEIKLRSKMTSALVEIYETENILTTPK